MTSEEIFDAGYAIPLYGLYLTPWLYRGQIIGTFPFDAVPRVSIDGLRFRVALVEDVRAAEKQRNAAISSRDSVN